MKSFSHLSDYAISCMLVWLLLPAVVAQEASPLLEINNGKWHLLIQPYTQMGRSHGYSDINLYTQGYSLAASLEKMMELAATQRVEVSAKNFPVKGRVMLKLQTHNGYPIEQASKEALLEVITQYGLLLEREQRPFKGWEMQITDKTLLNNHQFRPGAASGISSQVSIEKNVLIGKGMSLKKLAEFLAAHWRQPVWVTSADTGTYDFELDISHPKTATNTLEQQYGLTLTPSSREEEVWVIKQ